MKLGILPLYAALYERIDPGSAEKSAEFAHTLTDKLTSAGICATAAPVCMTLADVAQAIDGFERDGADAIGVLFLAYHPSMQSAPALARTRLPVILLDTTPCLDFGPQSSPEQIMPCHGIHGVQDLSCVLRRMGKPYLIEAGYWESEDFLTRVVRAAKSATIAKAYVTARVGLIGRPFADMGDFELPFDEIRMRTGVQTVPLSAETCRKAYESVTDAEADTEATRLRASYSVEIADSAVLTAARTTVAVRKLAAEFRLSAFTFNFLDFCGDLGLPTIPFVAACELMREGIGYAGEGDVMTAALVGALLRVYPETSFAEMFCPDFLGDRVFLSHMGEINARVARRAALIHKDVPYVPPVGSAPSIGAVFKTGSAVWFNISPDQAGNRAILAPCHMDCPDTDAFGGSVRGWLDPRMPVADFLAKYTRYAGTHHSALVYHAELRVLEDAATLAGMPVDRI
ncbi:MAG: hypothetical protein VB111_06530 [Clostridiaceae bacterium]|nr:hypothetical protein [Clostridiaceae bacterium]